MTTATLNQEAIISELSNLTPKELAKLVEKVARQNQKAARKEYNKIYKEAYSDDVEEEEEFDRLEAEAELVGELASQWETLGDAMRSVRSDL